MTLIIGCITSEFGIIAGDTQLSVGDLNRGVYDRREVLIKVQKYDNLILGILGRWSYYITNDKGEASYLNEYDNLKRFIQSYKVKDKLAFLKKYLIGRDKIDATAIYIKYNEDKFTLDKVSNTDDKEGFNGIKTEEKKLLFNEPFYHTKDDYIKELITNLTEKHSIDNSLSKNIFLLNLVILDIISKGKTLVIEKEETSVLDVSNSVGGYVTIQVILKNIHCLNSLHFVYNYDYKTLLDKTSYPFSDYIYKNKVIRYVDNLSMLLKNSVERRNDNLLKDALIDVCILQIEYIIDNEILDANNMNILIEVINEKYHLKLDQIEVKEPDNLDEDIWTEFIFEDEDVNIEYLKRFF